MPVTELTSLEDYQNTLGQPGTVVVDFYSTQCPPCKVIAPFYEEIANKPSNNQVRFYKINGLEEPGTTIQKAAEVVWWPTLVIYEDGKETWRAKVPNPPSIQPIRDLEKILDDRSKSP
ncbi:hypothetical protein SAPIO_CDS6837 [Scedosporium apiospermum]|uniref:Thioredoxin domain-containing protein n=1 Tax=Pseudallescheria apiosperma TaxID=563466 RepID=A0A084G2W4_PSEDA|nr:uncharacterized protein SAPIO_CDS6837 [Scedosporium apiospermum]KEZ41676.1 hypothetical protein SAPIO_CDS6837 [Scedosporium apiospermum]